jgi:hypothetical protein
MSDKVNGFVICISIGEYSDRSDYYLVLPTKPDPQELLKMIETIHARTVKSMRKQTRWPNYWGIIHKVRDEFIKALKDTSGLSVIATLRNDAYDYNGDSKWELDTDTEWS